MFPYSSHWQLVLFLEQHHQLGCSHYPKPCSLFSKHNQVLNTKELNNINKHKSTVKTNHFILSLLHFNFSLLKSTLWTLPTTHTHQTPTSKWYFLEVCPQSATTASESNACLTVFITVCYVWGERYIRFRMS